MVVCFCWADLPASSPAGALPLAAEGVDELDIVATASSLLPTSLDTVIVLVAGFWKGVGRSGDFVRWNRGRELREQRTESLAMSEQVQEREWGAAAGRKEGSDSGGRVAERWGAEALLESERRGGARRQGRLWHGCYSRAIAGLGAR